MLNFEFKSRLYSRSSENIGNIENIGTVVLKQAQKRSLTCEVWLPESISHQEIPPPPDNCKTFHLTIDMMTCVAFSADRKDHYWAQAIWGANLEQLDSILQKTAFLLVQSRLACFWIAWLVGLLFVCHHAKITSSTSTDKNMAIESVQVIKAIGKNLFPDQTKKEE